MAKLAIFRGILTYIWHFHRYQPYLYSKRDVLGFYKQVTYSRPGDEPLQKWSIMDQKWPNMAGFSTLQSGPKGSERDQNGQPKCLPCLALFGPKWTIFRPSPVMNGRPQSEKKAHHHVSYVWPACGTPNMPFWNINMVAINEKCQK